MFVRKVALALFAVALASPARAVCGITDDASRVGFVFFISGESLQCLSLTGYCCVPRAGDCQHLLDNFPATLNFGSKCHYFVGAISHDAFNVACYGGCLEGARDPLGVVSSVKAKYIVAFAGLCTVIIQIWTMQYGLERSKITARD
ncbi:hypothetical protein BV22DRAFT_1177084 [Leucogyrophana mollusca]|uniref:Uncharacterized protein n=1 Tax=Leucogyrophana mollusca TaxID=85980 RepID=A0ACB8B9K8_9AGAM|nr:hypothetical protein BV22DRAFT_1177084 [Leucogyrophana mollusca]